MDPTQHPSDGPAASVEKIISLVREYAMHLHDAASHQASSKADIAASAALKKMGEIRAALLALRAEHAAEIERLRLRVQAAELVTEREMIDAAESGLRKLRDRAARKEAG